jgi:hypothetical protein
MTDTLRAKKFHFAVQMAEETLTTRGASAGSPRSITSYLSRRCARRNPFPARTASCIGCTGRVAPSLRGAAKTTGLSAAWRALMPYAYTGGGYYVQTSADVVTATRIARAVTGSEPTEAYSSNRRIGFPLEPDAPLIWFTCRAVLDVGCRTAARRVTWALRLRGHRARLRYSAPSKFWV